MTKSALVATALSVLAGTAVAQESEAPPPWLIACSNQANSAVLLCEMSQSIILSEGNQRLATAGFLKSAEVDGVEGRFTLPVGLFLPAGLRVSVDDTELGTVGFESCDAQGCYASGPVDEDWLSAMEEGAVLTLEIQRLDREVLSLGFDLAGFGDVLTVMP